MLVPYFDGERTPNRPGRVGYDRRAALRDARASTLARAAIEGVVCGLLDGLDALTDAGRPHRRRIVLVGGGARSAAYQRVLADLSGRPVVVPDASPSTSRPARACRPRRCCERATIAEVAREWELGARRRRSSRDLDVDRDAVRAAYAEARG